MSESTLRSWARSVLDAEGLSDWVVRHGEAYCWIKDHAIAFDFERHGRDYALFLHEVAHALVPRPEGYFLNHYHGGDWAAAYGRLVNRHTVPADQETLARALREQFEHSEITTLELPCDWLAEADALLTALRAQAPTA